MTLIYVCMCYQQYIHLASVKCEHRKILVFYFQSNHFIHKIILENVHYTKTNFVSFHFVSLRAERLLEVWHYHLNRCVSSVLFTFLLKCSLPRFGALKIWITPKKEKLDEKKNKIKSTK